MTQQIFRKSEVRKAIPQANNKGKVNEKKNQCKQAKFFGYSSIKQFSKNQKYPGDNTAQTANGQVFNRVSSRRPPGLSLLTVRKL